MVRLENVRSWHLGLGLAALMLLWPKKVLARGGDAPLLGEGGRGRISSPFGSRTGSDGVTRMHNGIDLPASVGTEVRAAASGTVIDVSPNGRRSGYGNVVLIEHTDGSVTLYAHLNRFARGIKEGVHVNGGDVIGYVGVTQLPRPPMVSKPHLHFEWLKEAVRTPAGYVVVNSKVPGRYEPSSRLRSVPRALA